MELRINNLYIQLLSLAVLVLFSGYANAGQTCAEREITLYAADPLDYLPPHLRNLQHRDNALLRKGYIDVRLYGADHTGHKDSTSALQKALDDASDYRLAVYLPPGSYVVSDTLHFVAKRISAVCASTVMTGDPRQPAKIILSESARGFDDPSDPQPVLAVWKVDRDKPIDHGAPGNTLGWTLNNNPRIAKYSVGYMQRIANLEVDTGRHRGAIGVHFRAAQDSHVENVTVVATNSYAGFYGLPSRTSAGAANITVIGGRFGIYIPRGDAGSVVVGANLLDQTESAVFSESFTPLSLVGFSISRKSPGSALTLAPPNQRVFAGSMVLYDGTIVQQSDDPAIANPAANGLYLRNVYINGTDKLIQKERGETLAATNRNWNRIDEYSYIASTPLSMTSLLNLTSLAEIGEARHLIDGKLDQSEIIRIDKNSAPPPDDLQNRHWLDTPFFLGDNVIDISEPPYSANGWDIPNKNNPQEALDTKILQRAIDDASATDAAVFLPRGFWFVDQTIKLHANTVLFGVGRAFSRIVTSQRWRPKEHTAVLQTVDDPQARTLAAHFGVEVEAKPSKSSWFNHLHWRAGRNSVVLGVAAQTISRGEQDTQARANFRVTDNGGGRWYFMGVHTKSARKNPGYRHLLIDNTQQPLWWYGLNMEKAHSDVMAEIIDAKNVRIFGSKNEGSAANFHIRSSNNVAIIGGGKHSAPPDNNSYFILDGESTRSSDNILIAAQSRYDKEKGADGADVLTETFTPPGSAPIRSSIAYGDGIALFKRGEIDDSAMRHDGVH